jgi:hypothetical protein
MAKEDSDKNDSVPKQRLSPSKRGYGDFFNWPMDRQLEEWSIVECLKESLEKANNTFFHSLFARGEGNDPPDIEAQLVGGGKLGVEVTELVDSTAILAYKNGNKNHSAAWEKEKLVEAISQRLKAKDESKNIKGGPYALYMLVIHTDEPNLYYDYVYPILNKYRFKPCKIIEKAYLLLSYDNKYQCCPYIELNIG